MTRNDGGDARWLLALESSTAHGGAALLRDGAPVETMRLEEGLRHGRELLPAAAAAMERHGLAAADLWGVAVSSGPGSYTGLRIGVMAAKALAYGAGPRLAAVSSLAALAQSLILSGAASGGDCLAVVQDARRDEVYAGLYRVEDGVAIALERDRAVAPEEAAAVLERLNREGVSPLRVGSGFATYARLFGEAPAAPGRVDPAAVGVLGWRQLIREESADPLALQPVYLRRDADADWRHDSLIANP